MMETEFYNNVPLVEGPFIGLTADYAMIPIVGIVMGGLLLISIVCGLICIGFVKAVRGGGSTKAQRKVNQDEARAFQQMERGFRRMEERIDSLETLLMGRSQRTASDREFS
ncbi:MAG: hypothetical protein VCD00_01205 [Candidatus Hydrogenedentota bacterium]